MACSSSNPDFALSYGALRKIFRGESLKNVFLQILGYKRITDDSNGQYRLLLNDGLTYPAYAVLDNRLNFAIYKRKLEKYTIFKLKDYTLNNLFNNNNVLVCTDIETIVPGSAVNQQIFFKAFPFSDDQEDFERNVSICTTLTHANQNADLESRTTTPDIDKNFEVVKNDKNLEIGKNQEHLEVVTTRQNSTVANIEMIVSGSLVNQEIKSFPLNVDKEVFKGNVSISMTLTHANGKVIIKSCSNATEKDKNFEATGTNKNLEVSRIDQYLEVVGCDKQFDEVRSVENSEVANIYQNPKINFENHSMIPIIYLSPYITEWRIKARVTYKTTIFSYSNKRQGKYFSFYLLDDSGEIQATAFDEDAERIYELLTQNKVYVISNSDVMPTKCICPVEHDFEIKINKNSKIEQYRGDESSIPKLMYDFKPISRIKSLAINSYTDAIGICDSISGKKIVPSKYKEISYARHFILRDKSMETITVTLWGRIAENFHYTDNHVVAIRNAKVTHYQGCVSLSVCAKSMIFIDPDIPEATDMIS